MSGIVGGINLRSSGLVNNSSATDGQVFTGTGAGLPAGFEAAAGGGKVLQIVSTFTGASSSGSGAIPLDDTIPQAGAGHEVMTLAVTPQESDSKLWIQVVVTGCTDNQGDFSLALFQDSTANALACLSQRGTSQTNNDQTLTLSYVMTAGTTSATTFKVRLGATGGTLTTNGHNTNREYGGVQTTALTIMEIAV